MAICGLHTSTPQPPNSFVCFSVMLAADCAFRFHKPFPVSFNSQLHSCIRYSELLVSVPPHSRLPIHLKLLLWLQIMASRLKILLMPPGRGIVPPFDQATPADPSTMAPVIMTGLWEERKSDHDFKGRIRSLPTLRAQQGLA